MFSWLAHLTARLRATFKPAMLDRDLNDELDTHVSLLADEYERRGMSREDARRKAMVELGGVAQLREAHREVRSLPFLETFWRDLHYSFRSLRRDAGFTTFAILITALGVGAGTTIFSVVNTLLLRPLPVRDAASLVWVKPASTNPEGDLSSETLKVNPFVEFRDQNRSFSGMAAYFAFYQPGSANLTGAGEPERLTALPVSQNFFPLLGVAPRVGRNFSQEECQANLPVALLTEGFWKRRFAGDPSVVGRTLTINARLVTVLGVVPFDFGAVLAPGTRVDLYVPLPLTADVNRWGNTLAAVGRLRPGVSIRQAQAEADVLIGPIGARNEREGLRLVLSSLNEHVRGRIRPALLVLACAVGVVMLIVCANLFNLQVARAAARQKEFAIRVALGAGRGRLITQMLTEGLLLSSCAALAGVAMAALGTRLVASLNAISIPLLASVRLDPMALAFAVVAATLIGVLLGLAPMIQAPLMAVHDTLKDSNRGSSAGGGRVWIRSAVVVSEISFACILLIGSGLLLRSFLRVLEVDPGFRAEHAIAIRVDPKRENRNAALDEVLRVGRALPGITAAGLTDVLPLGGNRSWGAGAKGRAYSLSHPPPDVFVRIVSEGYLTSMGIPLRSGRDLTERDRTGSKPVILINESLARKLWPDEEPLGKYIEADAEREVVGVVSDVRHIALERESGFEIYLPIRQTRDYSAVHMVVRSSIPPLGIASALLAGLRTLEPNLPAELVVLKDLVDRSVSPRRFIVVLTSVFSAFALLLAALGVYAVISYAVNQQTQEIGIRMALGASASDIQGRVLRRTLALAGTGMAIGFVASWFLARMLTGLLYGITSSDPLTYLGMAATLTMAAAAAGYLPARRASRTDPLTALRAG
ncbi:ABC transporter permease [uncultured Paludibaculum sp.]|uniref:ABC transporter permease n=1 Tax=uncultured Paludibaculum sp. TaxID=1765020 RepID=UPI002AABE0FB|nr:ABC transporter permease [uncultured Paludibaculum sp.]